MLLMLDRPFPDRDVLQISGEAKAELIRAIRLLEVVRRKHGLHLAGASVCAVAWEDLNSDDKEAFAIAGKIYAKWAI